jgi:formate dehydrogenase major subunit
MFDASVAGRFKGLYVPGRGRRAVRPQHPARQAALRGLECLVVQDLFLNETARFAHVFLPGSSFLEKNGTFTNAERRISPVRKAIEPLAGKEDWEVTAGAEPTPSATR